MRVLRLGLLAVVILAGVAFHDKGTVYTAIRIAYYAVILGGLGYFFYRRSAAKRGDTIATGGPPGPGPSPTLPGEAGPTTTPVREPGWFPDQQDMKLQRYWDGSAWTHTRRWEGDRWVDS
jgi:hypothetical protein